MTMMGAPDVDVIQVIIMGLLTLLSCMALAGGVVWLVEYATTPPIIRADHYTRKKSQDVHVLGGGNLKANAIGMAEAAAQSFGAMSPIMAICLVTPIIASNAGFATPAAILIAGIASLLCGRVIAKFAVVYQSAGSLFTYAAGSLGPTFGFFSGVIYTMAMTLLTIGGFAFLADFALTYFQSFHAFSGAIIACSMSLILGAISYFGISVSTRAQLLVTAISSIFVLLLGLDIITVRVTGDTNKTAISGSQFPGVWVRVGESLSPASASSVSSFSKAVLSALLIFAGYESASSLAEEAKDASHTIPTAVVFTVIICCLFYCWSSLTLALGYNSAQEWASDSSTLVTLGTRYGGEFAGSILFLCVLFDGWAGSLACVNLVARLYFAFARDGFFPAILSSVSIHGTPHLAIGLITSLTATTCACTVAAGGTLRDIFSFAIDSGSVLIQISYFLVMIGGFFKFKSVEAIFAATIPAGAVLGSVLDRSLSPGYTFALAFLLCAGILVAILALLFPEKVARANKKKKKERRSHYDYFDTPPQLNSMNLQVDDEEETEPLLGAINT